MEIKKNELGLVGGGTVAFIVLLTILFGTAGFRFSAGFILLFFLPFYFILEGFSFSFWEKIIFSFFLGIGITSTLVFFLGILISFRMAMLIIFLVLVSTAVFLLLRRKKQP